MLKLPRIYPILDTHILAVRNCGVAEAAEALLEAGMRILQFRHKGPFTREAFRISEQVALLCRDAGALYIVDDRADIALLLGAGVHIGQNDLTPGDVRKIVGKDAIVGYSTHNEQQLRAAVTEPVDYVAIGPVYATLSKINPDPVLGVERVRELRLLSDRPLVAIGGITVENAADVLAAGVDSVALIGALLPEPCTKARIRSRAELLLAIHT